MRALWPLALLLAGCVDDIPEVTPCDAHDQCGAGRVCRAGACVAGEADAAGMDADASVIDMARAEDGPLTDGPAPDVGTDGASPEVGTDGPPSDTGTDGTLPDEGADGPPPDEGNDGPTPDEGIDGPLPDEGTDGPLPDEGTDGPELDGPPLDGPPLDGPLPDGPPLDGPLPDGPAPDLAAADMAPDALMPECDPGQVEACSTDVGACVAGARACDEDGFWGPCSGVLPERERFGPDPDDPGDGVDEDCDGRVDEQPCGDFEYQSGDGRGAPCDVRVDERVARLGPQDMAELARLAPGTVVYLEPGIYDAVPDLEIDRITLRGAGTNADGGTVFRGAVRVVADEVRLSGLRVEGEDAATALSLEGRRAAVSEPATGILVTGDYAWLSRVSVDDVLGGTEVQPGCEPWDGTDAVGVALRGAEPVLVGVQVSLVEGAHAAAARDGCPDGGDGGDATGIEVSVDDAWVKRSTTRGLQGGDGGNAGLGGRGGNGGTARALALTSGRGGVFVDNTLEGTAGGSPRRGDPDAPPGASGTGFAVHFASVEQARQRFVRNTADEGQPVVVLHEARDRAVVTMPNDALFSNHANTTNLGKVVVVDSERIQLDGVWLGTVTQEPARRGVDADAVVPSPTIQAIYVVNSREVEITQCEVAVIAGGEGADGAQTGGSGSSGGDGAAIVIEDSTDVSVIDTEIVEVRGGRGGDGAAGGTGGTGGVAYGLVLRGDTANVTVSGTSFTEVFGGDGGVGTVGGTDGNDQTGVAILVDVEPENEASLTFGAGNAIRFTPLVFPRAGDGPFLADGDETGPLAWDATPVCWNRTRTCTGIVARGDFPTTLRNLEISGVRGRSGPAGARGARGGLLDHGVFGVLAAEARLDVRAVRISDVQLGAPGPGGRGASPAWGGEGFAAIGLRVVEPLFLGIDDLRVSGVSVVAGRPGAGGAPAEPPRFALGVGLHTAIPTSVRHLLVHDIVGPNATGLLVDGPEAEGLHFEAVTIANIEATDPEGLSVCVLGRQYDDSVPWSMEYAILTGAGFHSGFSNLDGRPAGATYDRVLVFDADDPEPGEPPTMLNVVRADPRFSDGDFHLEQLSPAVDQGPVGQDCGAEPGDGNCSRDLGYWSGTDEASLGL